MKTAAHVSGSRHVGALPVRSGFATSFALKMFLLQIGLEEIQRGQVKTPIGATTALSTLAQSAVCGAT
jgi:hypothetical protein